jgi:hypothetical protein
MVSHIKVYHALLGISQATQYDETTQQEVPYKLNTAEKNSLLAHLEPRDICGLLEEASDYWKNTEKIYYMPSRWMVSALKEIDVHKELKTLKASYKNLSDWVFECS